MNPVRASRSFLTPPRQHLLHRPPRGSCRNSRKRSPTVYPHSPCGSPAGRVPARTIWPLAPMIYLRFSSWGAAPCRAPLPMEKYDLIVIGSGPGGQRAAIQAAKFGKKAALVEKLEVIGGTAINTGTIPSKTMREAVLHLSGFYYQSIYGVNYRVKEPITMADLSFRAQHVIKTEIDVIRAQLSRNGIDVLTGTASFLDPHRIQVTSARGQAEVQTQHIILATGTKPAVSPLVPFNNKTIINSDQILSMP